MRGRQCTVKLGRGFTDVPPACPLPPLPGLAGAWIGLTVQHCGNHGAMSTSPAINGLLGLTNDLVGGSSLMWRYHHQVRWGVCVGGALSCGATTFGCEGGLGEGKNQGNGVCPNVGKGEEVRGGGSSNDGRHEDSNNGHNNTVIRVVLLVITGIPMPEYCNMGGDSSSNDGHSNAIVRAVLCATCAVLTLPVLCPWQ